MSSLNLAKIVLFFPSHQTMSEHPSCEPSSGPGCCCLWSWGTGMWKDRMEGKKKAKHDKVFSPYLLCSPNFLVAEGPFPGYINQAKNTKHSPGKQEPTAPHSQAALKYLLQDYLHRVPFTALSSCHFLVGSQILSGILKQDSPSPCHCHHPRAGSV